jgi:hypothetical protein
VAGGGDDVKRLTRNDIDLIHQLWTIGNVHRSDLATWEQRTAARLLAAGVIQASNYTADLSGSGYLHTGGNGYHVVYSFDPVVTLANTEYTIAEQLRTAIPDLLVPRPIGASAQQRFTVIK